MAFSGIVFIGDIAAPPTIGLAETGVIDIVETAIANPATRLRSFKAFMARSSHGQQSFCRNASEDTKLVAPRMRSGNLLIASIDGDRRDSQ
ncbi:hypothetical protein [Sphingomonas oryzagri]